MKVSSGPNGYIFNVEKAKLEKRLKNIKKRCALASKAILRTAATAENLTVANTSAKRPANEMSPGKHMEVVGGSADGQTVSRNRRRAEFW